MELIELLENSHSLYELKGDFQVTKRRLINRRSELTTVNTNKMCQNAKRYDYTLEKRELKTHTSDINISI